MFDKHLIVKVGKETNLFLYINFDYEFSILNNFGKKEKEENIIKQALSYIKNKRINFQGTKVFLVANGIIFGSIFLNQYSPKSLKEEITPKYQYVEYTKDFWERKPVIKIEKETKKIDEKINKPSSKPKETFESPRENKITPKVEETSTTKTIIHLKRSNQEVIEIELEDYIIGVVAAEMPASFPLEALKAQAVAARTYALKQIKTNQFLYDNDTHQNYKDQNQLKALWGNNFNTYFNKIKKAVNDTKEEYLTYNNSYIDAVYHSTSNGKTEDAKAVWGNNIPYLKSVDSHWDLAMPNYLKETSKEFNLINDILGLNINNDSLIEVLSFTDSQRIEKIKIDEKVFTGLELRNLLGLRSTDFEFSFIDNELKIITRGYGHGVGMSQYGASGMAKEGYNYKEILLHYYPGVSISK
jgi:stage II sporulation protein D